MKAPDNNCCCISAATIKAAAATVGFHACGIAAACHLSDFQAELNSWLSQGYEADMQYMGQHSDMRCDPTLLLPGAKSVISVLLGYKPSRTMSGNNQIAQYAYGEDYHEVVKKMLFLMIAEIKKTHPDFEAKPCVDTVPIADKHWAARAGLGWIGKNTLLINPELGSYCFVGELVTTAEITPYDVPADNLCGSCTRCVDACPNHAIKQLPNLGTYVVEAGKCLSYQTIENRADELPADLKRNNYAFGCDCCQLACPHNQDTLPQIDISPERIKELEALQQADQPTFKRFVKHSALNRIKYPQWQRNLKK